jgi:hypothetical protein
VTGTIVMSQQLIFSKDMQNQSSQNKKFIFFNTCRLIFAYFFEKLVFILIVIVRNMANCNNMFNFRCRLAMLL